MRILCALLFCLAFQAAPAAADDVCEDLWYSRNRIVDMAGYCFGSALGKALFDNSDCTGKSVTLGRVEQQTVAAIREIEKQYGCKVNTNATRLNLKDMAIRRQLIDQPIYDEIQGACREWIGPTLPLYAGKSRGSAVIGEIRAGDYVSVAHYSVDAQGGFAHDGGYVTTHGPGGGLRSGGWVLDDMAEHMCREWIG